MKYQIENTTQTRTTDREYTHAVIIPRAAGLPEKVVGYCGSLELAGKLLRSSEAARLAKCYQGTPEIRPVIRVK